MSSVSSPAALPQFIATLLGERARLVADIATIDATLARVTAALEGPGTAPVKAVKAASKATTKSARKSARVKIAPATKAVPVGKPAAKKAGKGGLTAHQFVIDFVTGKKSATTQDINKHWKESGRLGNADNTMSQLTKAKKLKRSPLTGGLRGSSYAVI